MPDFAKARAAMVEGQVRVNAVTDKRLILAMANIPRERFVPAAVAGLAYIDEDIRISDSPLRHLMEPMPFARLAQLAEVRADDVALVVACGTGYAAAVLAQLANSAVAVDSSAELVEQANENLAAIGVGNAVAVEGNPAAGYSDEAPFDVIFIDGAVDDVPETLLAQLRNGGRLVAMVRKGPTAEGTVFVRSGNDYSDRVAFQAGVPVLPEFYRTPTFAL